RERDERGGPQRAGRAGRRAWSCRHRRARLAPGCAKRRGTGSLGEGSLLVRTAEADDRDDGTRGAREEHADRRWHTAHLGALEQHSMERAHRPVVGAEGREHGEPARKGRYWREGAAHSPKAIAPRLASTLNVRPFDRARPAPPERH